MRIEKDSMGSMQVPDDAYYGAQTQRAVENFEILITFLDPSNEKIARSNKVCFSKNFQLKKQLQG